GATRRAAGGRGDPGVLGGRGPAAALVLAAGRGGAGDRARRDGAHGTAAAADRGAGAAHPGGPAAALRGAEEAALLAAGVRAAEHLSRGAGGLRALGGGRRTRHRPAGQVAAGVRRPGLLAARTLR